MQKNIYQKHVKISKREQRMLEECKESIQKFVDAHDLPKECKVTDSDVIRQAVNCLWKMLNEGDKYKALWQLVEELEG